MIRPLCIYHGFCDDGFGAAWAVRRALGEAVEFFPGVYQKEPPDVAGRDVVIVDFSYKRPVLESMARQAHTITILDHHKSALEDLAPYAEPDSTFDLDADDFAELCHFAGKLPIRALFDMERSGAGLAWDHFHGHETRPPFINYLEDRDLWRKSLPGGDEFTMALRSYPQHFELWDEFAKPGATEALIAEGRGIHRYYRQRVDELKRNAYRASIAGIEVPVCNAPYFVASELAGELAEGEPFAACYFQTAENVTFSLRSRAPDGADVAEIAARYGGGGHKHAAGFRVPRVEVLPIS